MRLVDDVLKVVRPIKKWRTFEAPPWFSEENYDASATVVYHGICRRCKAVAEADGNGRHNYDDDQYWYKPTEPWFRKTNGKTYARRVKWQSDHERLWRIDTVLKMDYETWLWTHSHAERELTEPERHASEKYIPNLPDTGGTGQPS